MKMRRSTAAIACAATALVSVSTGLAQAAPSAPDQRSASSAVPPTRTTSEGKPVDLGALFIGAHPDDEAFTLSTLGQWKQNYGLRTGVITITRGEGGGNAVGPEEGPALGLLRESEERAAVGTAGVRDIFNLDKVDFYYTVSQPLTQQIWGHDDTLARVVRIIRETRPEILLTMNPAPSPGQHGNHQEAARLAIEAFYAAADPRKFPEQITQEHLKPWAPAKILRGGASGTGKLGPNCGTGYAATQPTDDVFGVWAGAPADQGGTWAQVERAAQRKYASQGWAGFPDVPTDPNQLGCDYFTQIDSRVPFPAVGTAEAGTAAAILDGAVRRAPRDLPLGSGLRITPDRYYVQSGGSLKVTVRVTAPSNRTLRRVRLYPRLPDGWTVDGRLQVGKVRAGRSVTRVLRVTAATNAAPDVRSRLGLDVRSAQGRGYTDAVVQTTANVSAQQQLLPQVAAFEKWAAGLGRPNLQGIVTPVLTIPSGGNRTIPVTVTNRGTTTESGTVTPEPPAGFAVKPERASYAGLAPGASTTVTFTVTNTDATLKTSNQGGTGGDYPWTITTTSSSDSSVAKAALELVPTMTIGEAAADPTIDGRDSAGEYPGPAMDISRVWEGQPCASAGDCSATAKLAWRNDTLYVLVDVTDDILGTKLDVSDCKRHWRTDSVELAIDPRGASENTSTTFKAFILPTTAQNRPCFGRDADNHQGGPETAPGMTVASTLRDGGYTVETAIPMADLPGAIDPQHLGLNLFVYDSDTQDKTGQTRIGWSTWQGVQGDPYRWGIAKVEGYTPPAGRPTTAPPPIIPLTALQSVDSPPSIEQAVRNNVALAGGPASKRTNAGWVVRARSGTSAVTVRMRANGTGTAHIFIVDNQGTAGSRTVKVALTGVVRVPVRLTRALDANARADVGWKDSTGATISSSVRVR